MYVKEIKDKEKISQINNQVNLLFYEKVNLPDQVFKNKFEFLLLAGHGIFTRNQLDAFTKFLMKINEEFFFIFWRYPNGLNLLIEAKVDHANIIYDDMVDVQQEFFVPEQDCYIVGLRNDWAMYSHSAGINILGFNYNYKKIIGEVFENQKDIYADEAELKHDLDGEYRGEYLKDFVQKMQQNYF